MPMIRPVTDIQSDWTAISEAVHIGREPVFLTNNGRGDIVVMSMEAYQEKFFWDDVRTKIAEARAEIAAGDKGMDAKQFLKGLLSDYE